MWQIITDPETMAASPALGRMLHDQQLNLQNEKDADDLFFFLDELIDEEYVDGRLVVDVF